MFKKLINCACAAKWQSCAPFVLRVVVGITFALHGWQKVSGGLEGVTGFFASLGIPAPMFFAFIVTWVEFLGGIALILGLLTHWAAKLLAINMLVAIFTVHISKGFFVPAGVELPLILLAACISLMITGPGCWALGKGGCNCKDGCCDGGKDCGSCGCCKGGACSGGVCKPEMK